MATSLSPLKSKAIYKQVLRWMSAMDFGPPFALTFPWLSEHGSNLPVSLISEVLLGCDTKQAEEVISSLCRWGEVFRLKHAVVPCYSLLVLGRCPKNPSSVSKKILLLLKSSTAATFHLFPPRILVYFSKLLNTKLCCCNIQPGFLV